MKCLTICQPYAALIVTPQAELPPYVEQKRIENRPWPTGYRGPLLVHAGKSRDWLNTFPTPIENLVYGAIIGVVRMVDVVRVNAFQTPATAKDDEKYPWICTHQHTEGPYCWILEGARRFVEPIGYQGARGLFNIPDEVVRFQLKQIGF